MLSVESSTIIGLCDGITNSKHDIIIGSDSTQMFNGSSTRNVLIGDVGGIGNLMTDVSNCVGIAEVSTGFPKANTSGQLMIGPGFYGNGLGMGTKTNFGFGVPIPTHTLDVGGVASVSAFISTNAVELDGTNAAPTGVTWGVTVPDRWLTVTNNGVVGFVPWFKNH